MPAHSALAGVQACVFDAYGTLFDFHSCVEGMRDEIGPGADALSARWRQKQLEYTWLRALMRHHVGFDVVTREALDHALEAVGLDAPALRDRLMSAYLTLDAYPEVPGALDALRAAGRRLAILSNGTPAMLDAACESSGLRPRFDALLSVEAVGVFKPDPRVYQLAVDALRVPADAVCFLSANAWDVAGAACFGMRAVWVNRGSAAPERLPGEPVATIRDLGRLPGLLGDGG